MNLEHFRAFVWLRWRLRVNQMKRGGLVGAVIQALLTVFIALFAVGLFVSFLLAGWFGLRDVEPATILYVWDGLVVAFLFFWLAGLIGDLQRAEPLSLHKFLHLPVSPTGAFVINYLSSLFSVTLLLFGSAMLGLSLGLVISRGPALLVQFPLVLAFVLALTALTYQFQGWLAALMANPRRRRTIVVVATGLFILLCQAPNLVNMLRLGDVEKQAAERAARVEAEKAALDRAVKAGEVPANEFQRRLDERRKAISRAEEDQTYATVWLINLALPPGWLPLGASASAERSFLPALIGTLGLGLIALASLWRAYSTTLRLYTGQFTSGKEYIREKEPASVSEAPAAPPKTRLLDRRLPWLSEQAAATALGSFTSFLRAPESKMMLLTPVLFAVVFGSMLFTRSLNPEPLMRVLLVFGGMSAVLLSTVQLSGNLFGFDRAGFRVFVLSPAPRREVLLGKNLAFAPVPLALGLLVLVVLEIVYPLRLDHLLAAPPMMLSMYLLFILTANWLSILAPIPIAAGSFKPASTKMVPLLFHMLFLVLFPAALAPALIPPGVEFVGEKLGWGNGIPICLILSLLECAGIVLFYRLAVGWQGVVLHAREKHILNVVTATKA